MRHRFVRAFFGGLLVALAICVPIGVFAASTGCATVAACIFGINSTNGIGVEGKSSSGIAVDGTSPFGIGVEGISARNSGVVGHTQVNPTSAGTGRAGVVGYDDSNNKTRYNSGVYGVSIFSTGVQGRSTDGPGVLALSYNGNGITASAGVPLYSGFTKVGVVAQSASGAGMIAVGSNTGLAGFATGDCMPAGCVSPLQQEIPTGAALTAGTDTDGLGLDIVTDTSPLVAQNAVNGVGATIDAGSIGMMITPDRGSRGAVGLIVNGTMDPRELNSPTQGAIISGFNALSVTGQQVGVAVSGDPAIVAEGGAGTTIFEGTTSLGATTSSLDGAGNLVIAGKLTENGPITMTLHNIDGTYSTSYTAHSTLPTVEDVGEAHVVSGTAFVPIDPALHKAIDTSRGYLVFVTPQGATTGLYVTNKTAAGFSVREIGNARDSLAFDYRIVAQPNAEPGTRLANTSAAIRSAPVRKALFYRHMKPLRFNHGKLDPASLPLPSM